MVLGIFARWLESVKNVIVEYPGVTVGYTHSLSCLVSTRCLFIVVVLQMTIIASEQLMPRWRCSSYRVVRALPS